jgi:putative ABC transport system permease protein
VPFLPDDIVREVARQPGVQETQLISFVSMESPETGSRVLAVGREYDQPDRLFMDLDQGRPEEVLRGLNDKETPGIVLSKTLTFQLHKQLGDTFRVEYEGRAHSFKIVGTAGLYFLGGSAFYIDRRVAERVFGPLGVSVILVTAAPGRRAEVAQTLRRLCDQEGYVLQSLADFESWVEGILDAILAGLWALMAIAFVIAVFSVTNTLLVNVLEQTREIGLIRVIGMTRGQVRKMFLAQSALVGLLAIVPGCAVGVFLAYMVRSSTLAVVGGVTMNAATLTWVVPYAAAVLLLVLVFTWLPAARAARLPIMECIRTE